MDPEYKKKIPGFKSMGSWRVKEMEYTIAAISGDTVKVTVTVSADEAALPHNVKKYL